MKKTYQIITNYIDPIMRDAMYEKNGDLKEDAKQVLASINIGEQGGNNFIGSISLSQEATNMVVDANVNDQQAVIQNASSMVTNYLLQKIQKTIVSGKKFVNFVATKSFKNGNEIFDYTDGQKLEVIRQELISKKLPIESLAKIFMVKDGYLVVQDSIEIPNMNIKLDGKDIPLKNALEQIGEQLQKELTASGEQLSDALAKLQDGELSHWYDFKFVNDMQAEHPNVVKMFKDVMQYITELLITLSSFVKDIVNYAYNLYKEDVKLLGKNSDELLSDAAAYIRANDPAQWAKLVDNTSKDATCVIPDGVSNGNSMS